MERTGKNKPALVTSGVRIRKFFCINIEPTQIEGGEWKWLQVVLPPGGLKYEEIVSELVKLKYPENKMSEIINNYLNGSDKTDYLIMQAWRKESKSIAEEAIKYAIDNGLWEEPKDE